MNLTFALQVIGRKEGSGLGGTTNSLFCHNIHIYHNNQMFWYRNVDTTPSASISSISITTNVSIQEERGLNSSGFHVIDTYHTINCLATGKGEITAPASRSPTSITTINWGYNERGNNSPCWYVIDTYQLSTINCQLSGHRKGKITPLLTRHHQSFCLDTGMGKQLPL